MTHKSGNVIVRVSVGDDNESNCEFHEKVEKKLEKRLASDLYGDSIAEVIKNIVLDHFKR